MTKNGLDIQTISTKRTDKQADRVLLFGKLTEKKEKANPSHFLKFLCQPTFAKPRKPTRNPSFAKEPNLPRSTHNYYQFISYYLRYNCNLDQNNLTAMNRIKEVLADKGIKQTWLAEKLGKSYNMVNSYVQNRQQPRLEVLIEIAEILDVDVKELIESTKKNDQR
jgi:DNA-binding Xre family transcriptional regulator